MASKKLMVDRSKLREMVKAASFVCAGGVVSKAVVIWLQHPEEALDAGRAFVHALASNEIECTWGWLFDREHGTVFLEIGITGREDSLLILFDDDALHSLLREIFGGKALILTDDLSTARFPLVMGDLDKEQTCVFENIGDCGKKDWALYCTQGRR